MASSHFVAGSSERTSIRHARLYGRGSQCSRPKWPNLFPDGRDWSALARAGEGVNENGHLVGRPFYFRRCAAVLARSTFPGVRVLGRP